jgi:hypothetical protein
LFEDALDPKIPEPIGAVQKSAWPQFARIPMVPEACFAAILVRHR